MGAISTCSSGAAHPPGASGTIPSMTVQQVPPGQTTSSCSIVPTHFETCRRRYHHRHGWNVSTARNGQVEISYEEFGDPEEPTLLLVNGLGSQCLNYDVQWCRLFCDEGFHVVRFDNRDVGLSTKLDGADYALTDMADDAVAVLDTMGVDTAHVMGCSMGGMIAQRLALDHTDRLLSLTSVMSRTGEPGYGESSEEALAFLLAPAAPSRVAYIDRQVAALHVYGSKAEWIDDDAIRARAAAAYDRCFCPEGVGRQMKAIMRDGSRATELAKLDLPTLVIHGSRDTLIDPSGGRQTAEVIPGARYVEIDGMGHDYPPPVWREWVTIWSEFAHAAVARA
jgi:pimeloyl-ACP methyl ester carboxylesterase